MSRWLVLLVLLALAVSSQLQSSGPPIQEQRPAAQPPAAALSPEEERDRRVMERFLSVLEKNPRRGTALDRVYGYYVERGTLDTLVARYRERARKDPKDGSASMVLGLVEAQRGRDAAAVDAFRQAEANLPKDALASYYLGQSLVLVGQPDPAAQAFERAINRKPNPADLLEIFQSLGRVYQRAHRNEQALEVWSRLENLFPEDQHVQEQIATTLAEEAQHEQALIRFEALAQKTKDRYRQTSLRMEAAELKVRLGRTAAALADFETVLGQLDSDSWLYREVRRKIEEVFLRNDDLAGLSKYYAGWIDRNAEDVEAMARLARTLANQGRVPEAETWLAKALKLAPSRKELRQAYIDQLLAGGKIHEAIEQYEALVQTDPNNPDYLREWGRLILRDKSRPEGERKRSAQAVWRRLTDARPKDPVIGAQVADLFRQAEMVEEAISLYRHAIELAPAGAQYREYLGEYYHTLKRSAEALATWRPIAEGPNRSSKNLARLAEVLAGFGYHKEAVAAIAEACQLESDDFSLRLKYADLLHSSERYSDALEQLDLASRLAANAEEAEAVLQGQIKNYQAADSLDAQIAKLQKDVRDAGNAERWFRLARYLESARQLPEATEAIQRALALDNKSTKSWAAAARIHEAGGNLLAAADANRKLALIDRRYRTEYLTNVAKLESKLGRRDQALQAGRDLLAAAPGNPDHYQFFADLCFQLGQNEDGFDALRRAVQVNSEEPKLILTLASALAERFRTDEAIELYWRAFEKSRELDAKLGVITRLTELYLQGNRFDRLLERLDRERREADKQREMTLCLAQAYQSAGDFGTARQQLERLLSENARDGQLLGQLVALTEAEGDVAGATKYQRQLVQISPSKEAETRLAQLLLRAGDAEEAGALWARLVTGEHEAHRVMQGLDSLLSHARPETVVAITERLLREQPHNWEVLYRRGIALADSEKAEEASRCFQTLLDCRVDDDEPSAQAKQRLKDKAKAGRVATVGTSAPTIGPQAPPGPDVPAQQRINAVWQVRAAARLDPRYYYLNSQQSTWVPSDYGQARMAAVGWRLYLAQRAGLEEQFTKALREDRGKPQNPHAAWDWYYLQLVRWDARETYEAAKFLVKKADPAAQWVYLTALSGRVAPPGPRVVRNVVPGALDHTPPLPAGEVALVLDAYRGLRGRRPEWLTPTIVTNVTAELRRAKRTDEQARVIREAVEAANQVEAIVAILAAVGTDGSVEDALQLFEKADRLQTNWRRYGSLQMRQAAEALAQSMNARATAKAHADVLRFLDAYLVALRRQNRTNPPLRSRGSNPGYYQLWIGRNPRYSHFDFPDPNDYYDYGALLLLREAYELYRQADLVSDLVKHFRSQLDATAPSDRVYVYLVLGYLDWWNSDKDEALRELTRASDSAPLDLNLRLDIAQLRERRGEPDDALALLDAVAPVDNTMMQRRETAALRLAVRTGNLERARQAADRLFGLRLDAETQVQLATQMHQLGMHEAAEAVLARARRQAGNRTAALVSLMLQYQGQNKADTAVQVAHQILRRGATQSTAPFRYYEEGEQARAQAIQVLARSGKLKDLIERAEAQLKASPKSLQLHQALADYYKAAGDRVQTKAIYERIAGLKPGDAKVRYSVANQLAQAGESAAAVPHYRDAIKKDPSLFAVNYWMVQQSFQQAKKMDELVKLLEEIDLRALGGNFWSVTQIVQILLQDEKQRPAALRLFRKAWQAFPDRREYMVGSLYDEQIWRLPETYNYAREAMIPKSADVQVQSWSGVEQAMNWSGDGKVVSVVSRLVETAIRQNKLDTLARDVDGALKKFPDWNAGKALQAILNVRRGRTAEAKPALRELLDDKKDPMPTMARWVIAQELEDYGAVRDVVLKLHESAVEEALSDNMNMANLSYSPVQRLVGLYRRIGRKDQARALVLRFVRSDVSYPWDYSYSLYWRAQQLQTAGDLLLRLGYPVDAARVYNEVLSDEETLQGFQMWNGEGIRQQSQQGLERALQSLTAETLPDALRELLTSNGSSKGTRDGLPIRPNKGSSPALDPVIVIWPRQLDSASLHSLLVAALDSATKTPQLLREVRTRLDELRKQQPASISVHLADALLALAEGKPDPIADATSRLLNVVEGAPLEELPAGARANARQRADAAGQLGLWFVARQCYKMDNLRATGEKLGASALEAARRQSDPTLALAMLREWGQIDLDRGDRRSAERRWSQMLDLALPYTQRVVATLPPAAPRAAAPATESAKPAPSPARPAAPIPVVTLDQFNRAIEIARLAAARDMPTLCLRSVRDALRGGPPIKPPPNQMERRMMFYNPGGPVEGDQSPVYQQVEAQLEELNGLWNAKHFPASEVYEMLAAAVLPEARPSEVFLYPQVLNTEPPRSAGRLLAAWAARADKAKDLCKRVEARQAQPMAQLPARVLLAQIASATHEGARTADLARWFGKRLEKESLQNTAELVCHAVLPTLAVPEHSAAALPVLERAGKTLVTGNNNSAGGVLVALTRFYFEKNDLAAGRKRLQEYQNLAQKAALGGGGDYNRTEQARAAAAEFVRVGLVDDALPLLGQYADTASALRTFYNGPTALGGLAGSFARQWAMKAPAERYRLLKAWTMPGEGRKAVRLLAAFIPEDAPPASFMEGAKARSLPAGPASRAAGAGVLSTLELLITAAGEVKKLDELAAEARKLADQKVENAEILLALVQIAQGQAATAEPYVKRLLAELPGKLPKENTGTRYWFQAPKPVEWSDYLVARACLAQPPLQKLGEQAVKVLITHAQRLQDQQFLSHLRRDLAAVRGAASLPESGIGLWQPAAQETSMGHQSGSPLPWWSAYQDHVCHVTGPEQEYLYFNYPLTGTFEITAEAYCGGTGDAAFSYQDTMLEAAGRFTRLEDFNRMTLQVGPGSFRFLVNGHLVYEDDDPSVTSPWFGFFAGRDRQTAWRNLAIHGTPEVPRELRLTKGDQLDGWVSSFFGEQKRPRHRRPPAAAPAGPQPAAGSPPGVRVVQPGNLASAAMAPEGFDWSARDGVIRGRRSEWFPRKDALQSRLYYQRPLRAGDVLRYEFYYQPGEIMVHPALDRLTFVMEPDGVRLHWITDSTDPDWTGLKADNLVDERASRRGPSKLPLEPGEWNAVTLRMIGAAVSLELNGTEVYRRELEPNNGRLFGLFHYKDRTSAQVRNIVLTGNWPVRPELLTRFQIPSEPRGPQPQTGAGAMWEPLVSLNAHSIVAQGRSMTAEERYGFLSRWVFPDGSPAAARLYGDFTPADPAQAPVTESLPTARLQVAGRLEAPALELVAVAKSLGKLDELAKRVQQIRPSSDHDKRSKLAMLALTREAQGRDGETADALRQLMPLLEKIEPDEPRWARWPELLAVSNAIHRPALRADALALLDQMVNQVQKMTPEQRSSLGPVWDDHVSHVRGACRLLALPNDRMVLEGNAELRYWKPVAHARAETRGLGGAMPRWVVQKGEIMHYPGHAHDYMYLAVPLRGNFDFACELTGFGRRAAHISYAGLRLGIEEDLKTFELAHYNRPIRKETIDPSLTGIVADGWYAFRLTVRDGNCAFSVNGRTIHEDRVPSEPDPWLAVHVPAENTGGIRKVVVSGAPTHPETIDLSSAPDLSSWLAEYYNETVTGDAATWQMRGEEIYAPRVGASADGWPTWSGLRTKQESLLQYHRPLLEDGEMGYEFFYDPDKVAVHPTLDRLVFLLGADGLRVHWLTDGPFERTGLAPDNNVVERANRRGPAKLPLKARDWNRLRLTLNGNKAILRLNDVEVYERTLEPTSQRIFGLFHYADETEVRVRHVTYRGHWPRKLPPAEELMAPGRSTNDRTTKK
jgi:tetratricopeptide (TPR) repeat protein